MGDVFGTGKGRVDNTDESIQEIVQAMAGYFPEIAKSIRKEYDPQAEAEVGIAEKYTPRLGKLATAELERSGRDLSAIGRDLSREEQLAAAQTEADIMAGPGAQAARTGLALQKEADPEAFANRAKLAGDLDKAFSYLGDPNQLSKGEMEGIARGLGRTNSPVSSPMQTISNAMTFGDRQAGRRAEFNNLVGMRTNAAPALSSGMDMAGLAGRRTVLPNFGQQNYLGIQTPGLDQTNQLGNVFLNNAFATDRNRQALYTQSQQGKGIGQGTGRIIGSIAAGAMACWVAREVYGQESINWIVFREWLLHEAPSWFRNLYLAKGEKFAAWIADKPKIKAAVRFLMDFVVKKGN